MAGGEDGEDEEGEGGDEGCGVVDSEEDWLEFVIVVGVVVVVEEDRSLRGIGITTLGEGCEGDCCPARDSN